MRSSPGVTRERGPGSLLLYLQLFFICCLVSGCREQILHDLSEVEANKVISRLSASGARADKVLQSDGRWAIAVSADEVLSALSFLDSHRVLASRDTDPKQKPQGGLVPSREEQWFRYERSVAKAIEESLATMRGVLEARVHLHLPESDPLFGVRRDDRGSGSVLIVIDTVFSAKDEELAALVAGAAGISASNVRVLRSTASAAHDQTVGLVDKVTLPEATLEESRVKTVQADVPSLGEVPMVAAMSNVEIGIASAVGVSLLAFGAVFARRRRTTVTFPLPRDEQGQE